MNQKTDFQTIKIVILGDQSVGKTQLLNAIMGEDFEEFYKPTIGVQFQIKKFKVMRTKSQYFYHDPLLEQVQQPTKKIEQEQLLSIQFWDATGDRSYIPQINQYIKDSNSIFLCFSLESKESFDSIKNFWINFINEKCQKMIQVYLIGTKLDLKDKTIKESEINELISKNSNNKKISKILYYETSSKNDQGITELMELESLHNIHKSTIQQRQNSDNKSKKRDQVQKNDDQCQMCNIF